MQLCVSFLSIAQLFDFAVVVHDAIYTEYVHHRLFVWFCVPFSLLTDCSSLVIIVNAVL